MKSTLTLGMVLAILAVFMAPNAALATDNTVVPLPSPQAPASLQVLPQLCPLLPSHTAPLSGTVSNHGMAGKEVIGRLLDAGLNGSSEANERPAVSEISRAMSGYIGWPLVGGVTGSVIAVGLIILFLLKRRKDRVAAPEVTTGSADRLEAEGVVSMPAGNEESGSALERRSGLLRWRNAESMPLLEAIAKGEIIEITPTIDLCLPGGFKYPAADRHLPRSGRETAEILEGLAGEGILIKKPGQRLLLTPEGSPQIIPVECCPHCDGTDLAKGRVLEHFSCGYVGLEDDFQRGLQQICPKCKRELRLIGTDYRVIGTNYQCGDCRQVFPLPTTKWRSLETGAICSREQLQEIELSSYYVNEERRIELEFELAPKLKLIDCLKRNGYEVGEAVQVTGRSGYTHTLDILATCDNGIVSHRLGISVLRAGPGEDEVAAERVFLLESRLRDIGIDDKVIIAISKLSPEAKKVATAAGFLVLENEELQILMEAGFLATSTETKEGREEVIQRLTDVDVRAKIREVLQCDGYAVREKAKVRGKSGAEHVIDIYAEKKSALLTQAIAVAIACTTGKQVVDIDEITEFEAKASDAGIHNKVFVAVPRLSLEATRFAQEQGIEVFEAGDLVRIMPQAAVTHD